MMKRICLILLLLLLLCGCVGEPVEDVPDNQPKADASTDEADIRAADKKEEINDEKDVKTNSVDAPIEKPIVEDSPKQEYPFSYTAPDGTEYVVVKLITNTLWGGNSGQGVFSVFEFILNPQERNMENYSDVFRFTKKDGKVILNAIFHGDDEEDVKDSTKYFDINEYWNYSSSEYCSKAIAFLCDEKAIRQCFENYGVENIQDIVVSVFDPGYVVVAITDSEAYYMTVPIIAQEYSDFVFQKIHTSDEFKKMFGVRPLKVFVDGNSAAFSPQPVIAGMGEPVSLSEQYYLEMDILELLDALDVSWTYDQESKTVTFGDCKVQIGEYIWTIDPIYSEFIESAPKYRTFLTTPEFSNEKFGSVTYRNERYLGSFNLVRQICRAFEYEVEIDFSDYSIHINRR